MPSAIRRRHFPCCGLVRVLLENRYRNIACFALGETETLDSKRNQGFLFLLWYHQKTNFIPKWLYIFALKNRNKHNLPLFLHLNSAPFCSVSQSRVPTLMQSYCFILKYKQMHQNFAPPQFGNPTSRCKTMQNIISLVYLLI